MKRAARIHPILPRAIALTLASTLVASCWMPKNDWETHSRQNVTPGTTATLREGVGVTTLEEVLLQLGEPDAVSEDGRLLTYRWTKIEGVFLVGVMYLGGSANDITRASAVEITFDDDGYLASAKLLYGKLHLDW